MGELDIIVPGMWADHHVLAVRAALAGLTGVGNVEASAREFRLRVSYEPGAITPAAIEAALAGAGYERGEAPGAGPDERRKAEWATAASRSTTTDPADLAMSGDYRKY
jgi:copper chaperone CopZ